MHTIETYSRKEYMVALAIAYQLFGSEVESTLYDNLLLTAWLVVTGIKDDYQC